MTAAVALAVCLSGCASGTSGGPGANEMQDLNKTTDAASEADGELPDPDSLPEGAFFETKDGVTVVLYADKTSYDAGEEVNYTLEIYNEAPYQTISGKTFKYTNTGLVAASEGSMPDEIPNVRTGESIRLNGTLTGGEAPRENVKFDDGPEVNVFRPYVQIKYGEEQAMIRCLLNLRMMQVIRQIDAADRHDAKTVSVHDPSIFKDRNGRYYLVGTHVTSAVSDDLFDWTDRTQEFRNSLSADTRKQIRAWNDDHGEWFGYLWAPDIVYNDEMGKYCVYLSANGDNWKSNIVLLTADDFGGPYEYAGSVVYGGFDESNYEETDVKEVLGTDSLPERYLTYGTGNRKWGDMFPNCIDPCVFYDEDGNLWMTYGSWSGGIFMLELDEETGLRDVSVTYETGLHSDAYFGKLIAGGSYVSGEGSYVQHVGDYYYLFISYGNLEAAGGYNVRVYRSEAPDGPYVDALGNDAFYDTYEFNYNQSRGVRLFGGYRWHEMSVGQVAQGHNSAFVDDDGKAYVVFHTRTTDGSEGHYVKVHQMFVNRDGWLVAAPYRTDGETLETGLATDDLTGTYDLIVHKLDLDYANLEVNLPVEITLEDDGSITGAYEGSWTYEPDTGFMDLTFGGDTYDGVALKMHVEGSSVETTVFTALGQKTQITVWGSRLTARLSDAAVGKADKQDDQIDY